MNNFSKLVAGGTTSALLLLSTATSVFAQYGDDYYTTSYDDGSDAAGAVAGSMMLLVWCCLIIVPLAIGVGLAYWVYKDANKRGNENAVLWALLSFFFMPLGFIIYLLTQRDKSAQTAEKVETVTNTESSPSTTTDSSSTPN